MNTLPDWRLVDGYWTCSNDEDEYVALRASMMGFDLPDYDQWLSALPLCRLRVDMLRARHEVKRRLQPDEMWPYLKAMYYGRLVDIRETVLYPPAVKGEKFRPGKPRGALSPLNKAIRAYVRRHPRETAKDVWIALSERPPHGCTFVDSPRLGKYVENAATGQTIMEWPRFRNVVSEHKPKPAPRRR